MTLDTRTRTQLTAMTSSQTQHRQAQRINIVTAIADALLGLIKISVGSVTASGALIADGIHSLADLFTDLMVMVAMHFGRQAPDKQHPYGHGRIETMASLGLGFLLIAIAAIMGWDSIQAMFSPTHGAIGYAALGVTIVALLVKEAIFHWTIRAAREQRSPLLEASAWHSRSDSLSSLIVLVGLIGSALGVHWLDPLAALFVSILVGRIGADTLWQASRELIDTTLSDEEIASVRRSALTVTELRDIHDLRARHVGATICLDVHLMVDDDLSASEAHEIGNAVVGAIRRDHPTIRDITFHVDTEDDHLTKHAAQHLPLREEVKTALDDAWRDQAWWPHCQKMALHYQAHCDHTTRCIDLDFYLPDDIHVDSSALQQAYALTAHLPWRGQLTVWHAAVPCQDQRAHTE